MENKTFKKVKKMYLKCDDCGKENERVTYYKAFDAILCEPCCVKWKKHPIQKNIPSYGEMAFDDEGKVICHICGRAYNMLSQHIKQSHGINSAEYRKKFGLDKKTKLVSDKQHKRLVENGKKYSQYNLKRNKRIEEDQCKGQMNIEDYGL